MHNFETKPSADQVFAVGNMCVTPRWHVNAMAFLPQELRQREPQQRWRHACVRDITSPSC
jgi:hypothetical protein